MGHFMEIQLCKSFCSLKSFVYKCLYFFPFICSKDSSWQFIFSFLKMLVHVLGQVFLQMRKP